MSVLIKGMEMPKSCEYCDLCSDDGYCLAMGGDSLWDVLPEGAEYFPTGWKYEGCPLVEVPAPHGRLIDADALMKKCQNPYHGIRQWVEDFDIVKAPTVIEAEVTE